MKMKMKKMSMLGMVLLFLLIQSAVSQMVQCYSSFSVSDGNCTDVLGEVSLDDCCMNPKYGYEENGLCKSCRYASWTEWSEWSECSVSCLPGVTQRRRTCYGIGLCKDPYKQGSIQTKWCEDQNCCPEMGGWSEWAPWSSCSVSCARGTKRRTRICNNPSPECGGSCDGSGEETATCDTGTICPTHGGWSTWGSWGACLRTCQEERSQPIQQRHRTCTEPEPSTVPPGDDCQGSSIDIRECSGLPFCPVNGNWGPWSAPSECSVTCGVGRQERRRICDNPATKHGGRYCQGDDIIFSLCNTDVSCPADGHWTEWTPWGECRSPNERSIRCRIRMGQWMRERDCLGRDFDGKFCPGEVVDFNKCYDIDGCQFPAALSEWSEWSLCKPDCGENSIQTRKKSCIPVFPQSYKERSLNYFSGQPKLQDCPETQEESRKCLNLPEC